ncbi:MAG TPA: sugar phosphate isomerase/epimerase [Bryobacteraceae bacterium]|nr:sugar phosphate isomerase/epimerase [Bryobacteraceae bacterium]
MNPAITRRQFLAGSAVGLAAALPIKAFPLDLPLGFQSYDINRELSRDFEGSCRTLAGYGYQLIDYVWLAHNTGVSSSVNGMTGEDVRKAFDSAGLRCQNCHFSWSELHDEYPKTIEIAHTLGVNSVVCQSMSSHTKSADGWKWHADQLNELGEKTRRDRILTGYHNHTIEFTEIDGIVPFDLLLNGTNAKLVQMQLDVGSVAVAGKDPVAYLEKFPERYFSLHAKDVRDGKIGVAVGEGTLDWRRIFAAAKKAPLRNYVVETGARPELVMEKLKQSITFLRDFSV